jgi:hypothetical protein
MKKKGKVYEGEIEELTSNKIYLNINNLKKGKYKLRIVNKNKIIKNIDFNKE